MCQREICAFCEKCGESDRLKMCQESSTQPGSHQENYHLSPARPAIKTWKTNSLETCQESFVQWGSHQENYHLRLAQPAFKLKRQSLQSENVLRELCLARKSSRKLSSEACPTCNQTSKAESPLCTAFSQVLFLEWLGYFYETNGFFCTFYVRSISNPLDRHATPDSVNAQKPTSGE